MASEESIRLLCIQALKAHGPEFELAILAVFSELQEHFEDPASANAVVDLVQSALQRPPDA